MMFLTFTGSVVAHFSFLVMFLIISDLSRILGLALKKPPIYRMMYLSCALVFFGMVLDLMPNMNKTYSLLSDVIGLLLAAGVTYYYWKWLPADLMKG